MYAVIMAGGGGTRLHPLSRPERPKPFLPLLFMVRRQRRGQCVGVAFHHYAHNLIAVLLLACPPAAQLCRERRISPIGLMNTLQECRAGALLVLQGEA